MSSRTWVNVGAGIIGEVVGFFIAGPMGAMQGFMLGYAAAGIIQGPEAPKDGGMRPDEFQVMQSSESATVPVIFGTVRLAGNFLCYDKSTFKAKPVYDEAEGGKGGGEKPVSGYSYSMSWVAGLCMGPIDALVKIQGSPGMDEVEFHVVEDTSEKEDLAPDHLDRDQFIKWIEKFYANQEAAPTGPIDLSSGAAVMIAMKGTKEDSGSVWINPGTRTQTGHLTMEGVNYNYRDIVTATFVDFTMGGSAAPRTYLFTFSRMPVVLDEEGDVIAGFPNNASADPDDAEYGDANPAAILWELLTNPIWGKGHSPALLNVDDFTAAAIYFRDNRIGISTSVGDDHSNVELASRFRDLFGLVTWWENGQVRCRALWDRTNAYSPRIRITSEDIIGEPVFTRPSMTSATNEVRVTFTNRENNWQEEAATAMDLASIEQIGGIRSVKIDATEIGTRRTAELVAHRLLRTLAYPTAGCQLTVRRGFASVQPGDFIELVVDGWRGDAMTTFWRLDNIEDDHTGDDQVRITLVEDVYATGTDGEIEDFTAPIPSLELDDPLDNADLVTVDYSAPMPVGEITPVLLDEPNIWISKGERRLLVAVQRRSGVVQGIGVGFRESSVGNYTNAGIFQGFAFTGELLDPVAASGPKIIRLAANQFRLSLNHAPDALALLSSASAVQADSDGLDLLTGTNTALMVIGREIFRVGWIEETGSNEFTVRVAIRCEFASDKAAHAAGDTVYFFPIFDRQRMTQPTPTLPIGLPVDLGLNPQTITGFAAPTFLTGPDAGGFSGRSIQPLRPELVSATRAGTTWTIKLRPRLFTAGANSGPNLESELAAREADTANHWLRLEKSSAVLLTLANYFTGGSTGTAAMTVTDFTWTPPDGTSPATGLWTVVVQFDTNPANLTLYSVHAGQTSDPLIIPQPA